MKTWTHDWMLDYDYVAAILLKKNLSKKNSCLSCMCNESCLCGSPWSSPEVTITRVLTSLSELHFPSSCTRTLIASSPDAHLWDYLSHTHTHTLIAKSCIAQADISERAHLSLFDHCILTLDCFSCYLPAFWPSCLPWYSALVSPLISLLPLPTTACTTVLTLIKATNGSPLCWPIITVCQ